MVEAERRDLREPEADHLRETRGQLDRLDEIPARHGAEPREHKDRSLETLLGEAGKWAMMIDEAGPRDAGLIASAQRVERLA